VLHHRRGDEEIIECWDANHDGPARWRHAYPSRYRDDFGFDEGPRATPVIAGDRVFAFGAEGTLTCVDFATGTLVWSVPAASQYNASKGFFGFATSPLVYQDRVLVNLGGRDEAGIIALNARTGEVVWKATKHEASYASPVLAPIDGSPMAIFFTREGLVALDPAEGRVRFEFPWRSRQHASVNAATPLVLGNKVLLSASYNTGAVLLDLHAGAPKPVWSGDDAISSHYASLVARDGFLYGFHGRQEYGPTLRCVEAKTGRVQWSEEGLGAGSVLLANNRLLILTDRGELCVAPATPKSFSPLNRAQVLGSGTRAFPALADGRLYARDTRQLVSLNLREP
jgi:outer membrane protein assembly factor BamB